MGQVTRDTRQAGTRADGIIQHSEKRVAAEACIMLGQGQLDQGCTAVKRSHGDIIETQRACLCRLGNAETGKRCPAVRCNLQTAGKRLVGGSCEQHHIMTGPAGGQCSCHAGYAATAHAQ